ncbi:MAG: hypothetical protein AMS24_02930 [Chlamydiae bacterium SM23_39]|nr:MAG: hypothetical protein AMS24_02930 [Chlamydiae bacterium SM23_39]
MNVKYFIRIILLFIFPIFIFSKGELVVSLKTKSVFSPIFFYIDKTKSSLEDEFIDKVLDILWFDLNNNGYTYVVLQKEDFLKKYRYEKNFFGEIDFFQDKVKISVSNLKKVRLENILQLVKDIDLNRIKIHKLSDDILFFLLEKKGISQTKILYTKTEKDISEIWLCDYDGENKKRITFEKNCFLHPKFIDPYISKLTFIYVSYKEGIPKIYLFDDGVSRPLIFLRGNQLIPSLSKKRDALTFISDISGRVDLFYQKLKDKRAYGKPIQLFSFPRSVQASSSFSADDKRLVFVSDKEGSPRIYLLKIPKNVKNYKRPKVELLTIKNRENVTPCWSNDGTKIAYSAKTDGIRQIWIYDFLSKKEWQLTFGEKNKENPCWAEDNLHIVYNTEEKDMSKMYIININQKKPIKIGKGRFPNWEHKGKL